MKYYQLALSLFFFLSLVSSQAFAYLPVESSPGLSGSTITNIRGWACTNTTGTFYCYLFGGTGSDDLIVERYNATFQDRKWCDSGLSGASFMSGFGIANDTHVFWRQTDKGIRLVPIFNISSSTSCSASGGIGSGVGSNGFTWASAGYYDIGSDASAWDYFGSDGGVRYSSDMTLIASPFWDSSLSIIRFPNQTDNSTFYGVNYTFGDDGFYFWRYTNGAFDGFLANYEDAYNISYTGGVPPFFDLYKVNNSTTWLYLPGILANFSLLETIGQGTSIVAIDPIDNNSIVTNPPRLHIQISSANNGTLNWYIDGTLYGSQSFVANNTTSDIYFTPPVSITADYHTWYANFTDNFSVTWSTGTQWFKEGSANFFTDPGLWVAQSIGGLFSVRDLETSKNISSILFSFLIAAIVPIYLSSRTEIKIEPNNLISAYLFMFLALLCGFTFAGWFPVVFFAALLILAAAGFVKFGKVGG